MPAGQCFGGNSELNLLFNIGIFNFGKWDPEMNEEICEGKTRLVKLGR